MTSLYIKSPSPGQVNKTPEIIIIRQENITESQFSMCVCGGGGGGNINIRYDCIALHLQKSLI